MLWGRLPLVSRSDFKEDRYGQRKCVPFEPSPVSSVDFESVGRESDCEGTSVIWYLDWVHGKADIIIASLAYHPMANLLNPLLRKRRGDKVIVQFTPGI